MTGLRVDLRGVRMTHPGAPRPCLDALDLRVPAGQILVLLGASGAGKTTLLRVVAGLEVADAGEVLIGERRVSDPAIRVGPEHRGVGFVFQHLELWPHMSVAENVAFGLEGRPTGRAARAHPRVVEIATRVGIEALLHRSPATLSGGERQRVAIARTLAPRPAVVLYDEPLANLDPGRRTDLRRLIRSLCREQGATLLYVTHDAEEAMAVGDEIAVLSEGRVVDRGSPEDVYRRPTTLVGARALGPVTALATEVRAGTARTALGASVVDGSAPDGPAWLVLRPEAVRAGGEGDAEVAECRPLGAAWRVRTRLAEEWVLATAEQHLEPGARVGLEVVGPVALVSAEENA